MQFLFSRGGRGFESMPYWLNEHYYAFVLLLQQHQQRAYCATILPFNLKCLPASKAIASEKKNAKIPNAAVAAYTKTVKLGAFCCFFKASISPIKYLTAFVCCKKNYFWCQMISVAIIITYSQMLRLKDIISNYKKLENVNLNRFTKCMQRMM